ncbi:hypothetical protein S7711_09262 [Stachybotrys chartarum IBT 7711]|uniref:Zn(2)-C6 fungal-type domain-containing protein n=1 Tax=Stachybotrys chartarum (strain CBS 109288 / IBT 7711) TaxID=1280523 RepID=A0A084ALQ7_STACB|nr:hypothetical protein S7711_09262 [Stachybotrys chartarum IBT 7711]
MNHLVKGGSNRQHPLGPSQDTISIPKVQSSSGGSQLLKRSRAPGAIVSNACNECRKKRAKCDGNEPCSRCKAQESTECVYAVPVRHSKESLRTELEGLRHGVHSREQIFAALIHSDLREDILSRLQSGYPIEAITNWLEGALSSYDISRPTLSQHTGISIPAQLDITPILRRVAAEGNQVKSSSPLAAHQLRPWNDVSESSPGQSSPYNQINHMQSSNSSSVTMNWMAKVHGRGQSRASSWTVYIKQDMSKLNELMTEFQSATWTSITEDYEFVEHLLALYFCWEYPTFAPFSKEHFLGDFQNGKHRYCSPVLANALFALGCRFSTLPMSRTDPSDPLSSGDHFFKEAQRLLSQEIDHHSLTTIQALGIMSIREASCGRDSESYYYAGQSSRLTIEMGLHFVSKEEDEDKNFVQLVTFWGAFALDHMWSLATGSLPQFSHFRHLPPKPAIITAIDESLWMPYTDDGASTQLLYQQQSNEQSVYRCLCELSELAHISLYILRSPRRPSITRSLLDIYTRYLTWYEQIPEILRLGINFTPAVLFTQTPSFVPFFVLSVAMMQLAIGAASTQSDSYDPFQKSTQSTTKLDTPASDAISQCIADLDEMTSSCHFAKNASDFLQYHVKQWNMGVVQAGYCLYGFQQAQAKSLGLANMHTAQMAADGAENTLFSLFPLQRQPMMLRLSDLDQAGFSML